MLLVKPQFEVGRERVGKGGVVRDPVAHAEAIKAVIAAATHPILSGPAPKRLNESDFEEVIVTNTLPIPDGVNVPKLTVLSMAPLIARAIQAVFEEGSVASLFDSY